jgi:hypothetical protein
LGGNQEYRCLWDACLLLPLTRSCRTLRRFHQAEFAWLAAHAQEGRAGAVCSSRRLIAVDSALLSLVIQKTNRTMTESHVVGLPCPLAAVCVQYQESPDEVMNSFLVSASPPLVLTLDHLKRLSLKGKNRRHLETVGINNMIRCSDRTLKAQHNSTSRRSTDRTVP